MDFESDDCEALLVAVDETAAEIGMTLRHRRSETWRLLIVSHAGEALRQMRLEPPRLLLVCVTAASLEAAAGVIAELGRRRQGTPLVGVAAVHDEAVERAVRIAGATHYLALDSSADHDALERLAAGFGLPPPVRPPGRPPPHRALPPPLVRTSRDRPRPPPRC